MFLPPSPDASSLRKLGVRRLWHRLFDPCPQLRDFLGDQHKEVFDAFLVHCDQRALAMDWRIFVDLVEWAQFQEHLDLPQKVVTELFAASAFTWAVINRDYQYVGVQLASCFLVESSLVGYRSLDPLAEVEVYEIQWCEPTTATLDVRPQTNRFLIEEGKEHEQS